MSTDIEIDTVITRRGGVRIVASGLSARHRNGAVALDDVNLVLEPGRLTAIVGPSGAGKTTLLEALAGVRQADDGAVVFVAADGRSDGVGFVPQDDILHGELPLRRTLRYAAMLRMTAPAAEIDAAVDDALDILGLQDRADVPVASLSGGQRKRANIGIEILTRPGVLFLDEPTSGLDPAAAAGLVDCMRRMAAEGNTIVFTTHSVSDIDRSDHVVVVAAGGRVAASGPPAEVLALLGQETFVGIYDRLTVGDPADEAGVDSAASAVRRRTGPGFARPAAYRADRPGAWRQWRTLTRRSADVLTRNRLTVAILLGSPTAVIAMFAVLFRPMRAGGVAADPATAVQVAYWLAFASFFFGLTFGLLQVCTEVAILQRERFAGVRIGSYLASKLTLLLPVLLVVNIGMVAVLAGLDRLPDLSTTAFVQLLVTMALDSAAALCLGLLASAAVTSTAQAALALPMLCFPAVLFSGAIVPTPSMAGAGRAIASVMSDRWAFEAIAKHLGATRLTPPSSAYHGLGASSAGVYWLLLVAFTLVFAVAAYVAVRRRAAHGTRTHRSA